MATIIEFSEALKLSDGNSRSVILGNGFSIARAGGIFNYANLFEKADISPDSYIKRVFNVLNTYDFEEVMRALEHAAKIEEAYGDDERSIEFRRGADSVREALIHAIREVHPGVRFDVPDGQYEKCAEFLSNFDDIFTLNYDLQLYWVILRGIKRPFRESGLKTHTDGFGLGQEISGFRTFSEGAYCSTYYVHGALHLFDGESGDTRKRVVTGSKIVDDIAQTIRASQRLPLFVAEGTTRQKLRKINSVAYLRLCYEKIKEISGSLFIFGHSASENDIHIYDAVFSTGNLERVFFFIHNPTNDWSQVRERLARFGERRKDIDIFYVDAATARVWN